MFRQIVTSILTLMAFYVQAQTTFIGAANGSWGTASNWSNGLPAAGNNATIPGSASVAIDAPLTTTFNVEAFGTITLTANLTVSSGTFASSGGMTATAGAITVASGATFNSFSALNVSGTSTIVNNGTFNYNQPVTIATNLRNNGTFAGFANVNATGATVDNYGTFSTSQTLTVGTFNNQANASLRIEGGGTFRILAAGVVKTFATSTVVGAGSIMENNGTFTNCGTIQNFNTVNTSGTFHNDASTGGGKFLNNTNTNNTGTFTNKAGAEVSGGFTFTNRNLAYNFGIFTNSGDLKNLTATAQFCNESGGTMTSGFGTTVQNEGIFKNRVGATMNFNATVTTTGDWQNLGTMDALNGSTLTISGMFSNAGMLRNINRINNNGTFTNSGNMENNSGGTVFNDGTFTTTTTGAITNNFEITNKVTRTFTNNGKMLNNIRFFNEGTLINNGYWQTSGDTYNRVGATFTNNEAVEVNKGSFVNEGTLRNAKTFLVRSCSFFKNTSSVDNTGGNLVNYGLTFQRGTITGNALVNRNGFVHTGATSAAVGLCQNAVAGSDIAGDAKLYAQSLVGNAFVGIDSCFEFVYRANDEGRPVFPCSTVGTTQSVRLSIRTKTLDSLTCTAQVQVIDEVTPQFTNCPKNVTINTASTGSVYSWTAPTWTDNCTPANALVLTGTHVSGATFPVGVTTVTLSARDASGNTGDCQFAINVRQVTPTGTCPASDATPPVFSNCPANITLNTDAGSGVATWNEPTATDACLPIIITSTRGSGSRFASGTTTVTYTAQDPSGNVATCSFTVTVPTAADICATDVVKPVISNCPGAVFVTTNTGINGGVAIWDAPVVSDNCGSATLTSNYQSGSIFSVGTTAVVYTATDTRNNVSTCNFNVTVAATEPCLGDVTAPTISGCPANITVNTNSRTGGTATWTAPTATDACGAVSVNASHAPGATFIIGTTAVTYCFSDLKGNISKCNFTVTINNPCVIGDTTRPVISGCPTNIVLNATSENGVAATWTAPTATDNCSTASLTSNYASGSVLPIGVTTVRYVATDLNGNQSVCTFTVTVNRPSNFTCPSNAILNPDFENGFTSWAWLSNGPTITTDAYSGFKAAQLSNAALAVGVGQYITVVGGRRYTLRGFGKKTATEWAGFGFHYYAADGAFISGASASVSITGANYAEYILNSTAPANATLVLAWGWKDAGTGTATVDAYCVTNECDNDVVAPVISACPANITVVQTAAAGAIATWNAPTVLDNCATGTALTFVPSHFSGATFPVGVTTVTYTATDARNNRSTCTFTVTVTGNACVTDVTPPVLTTCPANITVVQTAAAGAVATWTAPTATDNCGAPNVTANYQSGATFPVGVTTVTYTAADARNNRSTCSFTVTVTANACATDVTPPTIACPANIALTATSASGAVATWANPTVSDNCTATGSILIQASQASGSTFPLGTTTVTLTASDARNNRATCTFNVVVSNTVTTCVGNLLTNAGFESDLTGFDNWASTTISTNAYSGTKAARIGTAVGGFGQWKNATPGSTYTFKTYSKITGEGWAGQGIAFYDAAWAKLGELSTTITATTYTLYTTTLVAPAGTVYVSVWQWKEGTTNYLTTDDWCLTATAGANCPRTRGSVAREIWLNIPGNTIAELTANPAYQGAAHRVDYMTDFKSAYCIADNYGSRTRGFIYPPVSGNYTFYLTGDDNAELYLNTTGSAASGKTRIAYLSTWANQDELTREANQTSMQIYLEANKEYYIEALQKEGAGGDHVAVWWKLPNTATPVVIAAAYLGRYDACLPTITNPCVTAPTVGGIVSPASQTITTAAAGVVPTRHTLAGQVGTILRWEYQYPNSTVWNNWGGGGSTAAPNNCCFNTVGTWKVRAIVKNNTCLEMPSSEGAIIVTAVPTLCTTAGSIEVNRWYAAPVWSSPIVLPTAAPNLVTYAGNTQGAWHIGDNYYTQARGYIRPAESGNFQFNVTGDDYVDLYISNSSSASGKQRVAYHSTWTSEFEYNKVTTQTSGQIYLTAGQLYYFEVRQIEGAGGDGWNLFWKTPSNQSWNIIPSQCLARGCTNTYAALRVETKAKAYKEGSTAKITWTTNGGFQNDYYIVERGNNMTGLFEQLDVVQGNTGTNDFQTFTFVDKKPQDGENGYRVTTVLQDGTIKKSEIMLLNFGKVEAIHVFPNPAEDVLNLDLKIFEERAVTVVLYDVNGKEVMRQHIEKATAAPIQLDIEALHSGTYLVRVSSEGKREQIQRIIIQK